MTLETDTPRKDGGRKLIMVSDRGAIDLSELKTWLECIMFCLIPPLAAMFVSSA